MQAEHILKIVQDVLDERKGQPSRHLMSGAKPVLPIIWWS